MPLQHAQDAFGSSVPATPADLEDPAQVIPPLEGERLRDREF